jgi:uncharacterized membrane protein
MNSKLKVGAFFASSGIAHLTFGKKFFERIVPPWLPASPELVNKAAGIAEIAGGTLAVIPGAERPARRYLVALLLAVFPANINMVFRPQDSGSEKIPEWLLWARLPLQFAAIGWVSKTLTPKPAPTPPAPATFQTAD